MRSVYRSTYGIVLVGLAVWLASSPAHAAGMDPTPERLVLQPKGLPAGQTCQSIAANPQIAVAAGMTPSSFLCSPDNVAFTNMISELGFAIAPSAMHAARTTGVGGFALTFEGSYTNISNNAYSTGADGSRTQYWHEGTQGSVDPNRDVYSTVNNHPDPMLQVYSLRARKGLPFGFEITGSVGLIANTTMWSSGADVRWSILEGFRTGFFGYLPDIAAGAGVRTLTGSSKIRLTTVGLDAQISKPITIADGVVLTPYLGYQYVMIFGNSDVLDSTPNTNALQQCGYQGTGSAMDPNNTGAPQCRNTVQTPQGPILNNSDFSNDMTFNPVRIDRHKGIIGVDYRYEIIYLGAQVGFDLINPGQLYSQLAGSRQWTTTIEAGVFF